MMIFTVLLLAVSLTLIDAHPTITVSGDVHVNTWFFSEQLPYLMNNLGGFFYLNFNILGHGVYAVPEICALQQLTGNNFLAAQYLQCEAKGVRSDICLCQAAIDVASFRSCVRSGAELARDTYIRFASKFSKDDTPIISYGDTWKLTGEQDIDTYFEKLCSIFPNNSQPYVCEHPLSFNNTYAGAATFACDGPHEF